MHQVPTHPQVELIESTVDQWLTDGPSAILEAITGRGGWGRRSLRIHSEPLNNVVETAGLLRFLAKASTPTLLASTSEIYGVGQTSSERPMICMANHCRTLVIRSQQGR